MNNFDFSISIWILVVIVIFRLIAGYNYLIVVIKAYKETGVKNGLEKLRQRLLISNSILLFVDLAGLSLLVIRPFSSPAIFLLATNSLAVINSVGFWYDSLIKKQLYTEQYTPEQKEFHKTIAKLETKRGKRNIRREVARVKLNKDRRDATIKRNK